MAVRFGLEGRVALVTGGGGQNTGLGIGSTLAAYGAAVVVNDVMSERAEAGAAAIREEGGSAIAMPFDITDYDAVLSGVRAAEQEVGPIDILVNNAGLPIGGQMLPFLDSKPAAWRPYIDINIFGSLNMMHVVLPGMVERGWGRIVQISSGSGSVASRGLGGSMYGGRQGGNRGSGAAHRHGGRTAWRHRQHPCPGADGEIARDDRSR